MKSLCHLKNKLAAHLLMTLTCFSVSTTAWSVGAELVNENLLQGLPAGYILGFNQRQGNMLINEWVPKGQTVNNWDDMITTQIFFGGLPFTPEDFYKKLSELWLNACPQGSSAIINQGVENGYPYIFWLSICPKNSSTGKPEYTYFKAIKGQDSFYVVQKASKITMPDKAHMDYVVKWSRYMKNIKVCDSRVQHSKCPTVN